MTPRETRSSFLEGDEVVDLQYFNITPLKAGAPSRPKIKVVKRRGLQISIPPHVAARAGLSDATAVTLKAAMNGVMRGVLVTADSAGAWQLTHNPSSVMLTVRELTPAGAIPEQEVDGEVREGGLLITLPSPWKLKDEHVVEKPAAAATVAVA